MYQPIHFAHAFEERGDEVITLATDLIENKDYKGKHVFNGMPSSTIQLLRSNQYALDMMYYVYINNPDIIIIFQSEIILNFKRVKINIPIYYYAKNSYALTLPRNCMIEGMFYNWPGGEQMFSHHYPWLMTNCKFHKYLPCGWSPSFFKYDKSVDRKYFIGFMGHYSSLEGKKSEDYNIKFMYTNRLKYKNFLEKHYKDLSKLFYKNTVEKYLYFMNRVNIAINIPAIHADVNERSFHSMGMGCVSLHYDNGNIYKYGFINRVNCLFFKNENELVEQITFALNNPSKIEEIRENGIRLSVNHRFRKRATEMRDIIDTGNM